MADLRKLKDRAAELAAKGKLEKAADVYREVLAEDPRDVVSLQKLADVLRRSGETARAIEAYRAVAERFGRDGLLIKAIAICKTILELEPDHAATQAALAELYSSRARAEAARPPQRGTLFMPAARPAAPPAHEAEDRNVVLPLPAPTPAPTPTPARTPPPLVRSAPAAVPPPRPPTLFVPAAAPTAPPPRVAVFTPPSPPAARALGDAATPLAEIVSAAREAVQAGVVEDVLVEIEPEGDLETVEAAAAGDEPLAAVPAPTPTATPTETTAATATTAAAPPPTPARTPPPVRPAAPPAPRAPTRFIPAVPAPPAATLPRVPIFSDLSRDAFLALAAGMILHRFEKGATVLREGEDGKSFFVVASGQLAVSKRDERGEPVVLARLGEGDFFGEMALLSGAPRSATVTAESTVEVLELRPELLLDLARRHPHLAQSLQRFYRQRLLANALAVSPVFRPFGRGDRKLIMERFRAREVRAGEVVVREGVPSDGLYVILEGAVDVSKRADGRERVVGHLREGDLFGEMSCLRKTPATATVTVRRGGTLLRLPRQAFDELVLTYPQLLELVSELSDERLENLDAILTGHAEWTDEGLVLI